jgi:hypothetical protein
MVNFLTELFEEHPLCTRPVKELIWGYEDEILKAAKGIDPKWFYTDIIGYFINVMHLFVSLLLILDRLNHHWISSRNYSKSLNSFFIMYEEPKPWVVTGAVALHLFSLLSF